MANNEDLEVDGRLQDGWQMVLTLDTGIVRYYRDHDNLASVRARWIAAKLAIRKPFNAVADGETMVLNFSGARAVEGGTDDEPVIGPVRGKGFVSAERIVDIGYSSQDGTEISGQAFEAAVAMLDVQRAALAQLAQGAQGEGAGAGAGGDGESAGEGLIG